MDVRGRTYGVVRERKASLASSGTHPSCPHYQGNFIKKVIFSFDCVCFTREYFVPRLSYIQAMFLHSI